MITINIVLALAAALGAAVVGIGSKFFLKGNNTIIEQTCEEIIRCETGMDLSQDNIDTLRKLITRRRESHALNNDQVRDEDDLR
jgi:hypothetical protein